MLVLPQPQKLERLPGTAVLAESGAARCTLVLAPGAAPLERVAAELLADTIEKHAGQRPAMAGSPDEHLAIYVGASAAHLSGIAGLLEQVPANSEGYALLVREDSIALLGRGGPGTFYAAQTLRQMLRCQGNQVVADAASVVDWPDYRYRGLYVESKWGPDLMGLEDWQELIDYMAGLKFNSLGIGVYGCWVVQYEGQRTEFLMLPFPGHPELQTPKTIRYYSARDREWKGLTYLPRMFAEDLFGQVVAYARSKNITVRPHFNGPGHSTLIPYTHPEVAARDEAGRPLDYGYCLSSPQTYALLFELWDSIIDRYLAPHGVDWFHMGLDEIWVAAGVDQENPERRVDPWCKCPDCRAKGQDELLTEYVIRATQHLAAKGMQHITIWYDHLSRSGMLTPAFVGELEKAGIKDKVILQWWRYDEPVLEVAQELGLRAWVTPMSGYYYWLFTQSYTSNIYPHLHLAYRAGAEGADAYCTFDPAYDRNYQCLAEYAWNQSTTGDLYQFKSRYAQKVMGTSGFAAAEAFDKWDQVYDSMPLVLNTLDILLPYWHTYSSARAEYPANVVKALLADRLRTANVYRRARTHLSRASALFAARRDQAPDPVLIDEYVCECQRFIAVADAYETTLEGIRQSQGATAMDSPEQAKAGLATAATTFGRGLQALDAAILRAEQVKRAYLLPQLLRDLSRLRGYLADLEAAARGAAASQNAMQRLVALLEQVGA